MGIKFANNASTNITHALTADATSVSVTPGTGDLFPSIVEGKDYFYATLAGNNGLEIVKVTKRVLDTMTIERAQDGTPALVFNQGDLFELRIVAADFEDTFSHVETLIEDAIDDVNSSIADLNTSVDNKLSSYLPLSGGTMTGGIRLVYPVFGERTDSASYLELHGGSTFDDGALLQLNGAARSDWTEGRGRWVLTANNGSGKVSHLFGTPDGGLYLNNSSVITSAGGTMTGTLRFGNRGRILYRDTDTRKDILLQATNSDNSNGATIVLKSGEEPDSAGIIQLSAVAADGTSSNVLLYPDGRWVKDGKNVLTSAGGTVTGGLVANSGINFKNYSLAHPPAQDSWGQSPIQFYGVNDVRYGFIQPFYKADGTVELRFAVSNNGTSNTYFNISSNGSATWNGRTVTTFTTDNKIQFPNGTQFWVA